MTPDITVGVLSLHNSKETKAILNAVDALGYGTEWLREETLSLAIDAGEVTLDPAVDIIVNRLLLSKDGHPAESLGLATTLDRTCPMLNPPMATMTAMHKFAAATALAEAGLPVPDAFMALSADRLNRNRTRFGPEAVYKTAIGTHGGGTWKVSADQQVNPMVGARQAFLQRFVEHDATRYSDLRVYVVGGEVIGAMNRYAPDGEWRTNVALGGEVTDATPELSEDITEMATRAADVLGLDYAGVDIIEGPDGHSILEVNPTAGFRGLFRAAGRSPAPFIAQLALERAGGDVDAERVHDLATTLDDSRPACMPREPAEPQDELSVIGYVESVVAMGTQGQKTVLAKSDTGATRTSIDSRLAAEIGTGPIKEIVNIKSGSQKASKSRPVVDLVVGVGGTQHTVSASVEDRSHMEYPILLGRDILEHYHVDVRRRADEQANGGEEPLE